MNDELRRHLAFLILIYYTREDASAVYDHDKKTHFQFRGQIDVDTLSVYDYEQKQTITGRSRDNVLNLSINHKDNNYISMRFDGSTFTGLVDATQDNFSGSIENKAVSIYDYVTETYFQYSI